MLFDYLLLSGCLLPNRYSYSENGVKIELQPQSGELILLFHIDDQSNRDCKFRRVLELDNQGMKMCDLIVFYAKDSTRNICFIELKGRDIETAIQQINNTYKYFHAKLNQSNACNLVPEVNTKACIVSRACVPIKPLDSYTSYKELKYNFGKENIYISKSSSLDRFLRGLNYEPKGKKNRK